MSQLSSLTSFLTTALKWARRRWNRDNSGSHKEHMCQCVRTRGQRFKPIKETTLEFRIVSLFGLWLLQRRICLVMGFWFHYLKYCSFPFYMPTSTHIFMKNAAIPDLSDKSHLFLCWNFKKGWFSLMSCIDVLEYNLWQRDVAPQSMQQHHDVLCTHDTHLFLSSNMDHLPVFIDTLGMKHWDCISQCLRACQIIVTTSKASGPWPLTCQGVVPSPPYLTWRCIRQSCDFTWLCVNWKWSLTTTEPLIIIIQLCSSVELFPAVVHRCFQQKSSDIPAYAALNGRQQNWWKNSNLCHFFPLGGNIVKLYYLHLL